VPGEEVEGMSFALGILTKPLLGGMDGWMGERKEENDEEEGGGGGGGGGWMRRGWIEVYVRSITF